MATDDPHFNAGLSAWRQQTNHNRMIELQDDAANQAAASAGVKLAHFASSAFRITTPCGLTIMIDPWRNHPNGKWDWYFHDFPLTTLDIGVSTHAHFDHDALHLLGPGYVLWREQVEPLVRAGAEPTGLPAEETVELTPSDPPDGEGF